ncbi:hypothetical protein CEXT_420591 [Caerostris extrusa]|uniref:Uncharacterized protein n=1 Tax=Caerostris extrusa TaxID=172846 RepID=A0AAV4T3H3_CAEEX|nr:hypothetical protein CEXT_420591 [Caerostris extrusa]
MVGKDGCYTLALLLTVAASTFLLRVKVQGALPGGTYFPSFSLHFTDIAQGFSVSCILLGAPTLQRTGGELFNWFGFYYPPPDDPYRILWFSCRYLRAGPIKHER